MEFLHHYFSLTQIEWNGAKYLVTEVNITKKNKSCYTNNVVV